MLVAVTGSMVGMENSTSWKAIHKTARVLTVQPTIEGNLKRAVEIARLPFHMLTVMGMAYPAARPYETFLVNNETSLQE